VVLFAAVHTSLSPGTCETSQRDPDKSAYEVKAVVRRTSSRGRSLMLPRMRWATRLLFSALFAAALAQPTDEPSDRARGQQERDDHAHADEHIGENDSGAVLDGHGGRTRSVSNASVRSVERIASPVHALSCFFGLHNGQIRLDSPASGAIYTPYFCIPSEAVRTFAPPLRPDIIFGKDRASLGVFDVLATEVD
jgi:hypothetical protein